MDRLLEQLATLNLAVGAEHESAERGRDDDARVILVARRNRARDVPQVCVAGVAVEVDVIGEVPRGSGLTCECLSLYSLGTSRVSEGES